MSAHLNVPNLDKLIAHLEAQPPERINMAFIGSPECGTPGCIMGHIKAVSHAASCTIDGFLDIDGSLGDDLACPPGWMDERLHAGGIRYPAHRVIATLKRLRDHYLATGEIVVDWGAEPTAGEPWAAPQAVELTPPALPAEITRLLSLAPATETSGA